MKEYVIFTLVLLSLVAFGSLFVVIIKHDMDCSTACGTDPVAKCYRDRAECVGMDKHYMAPVK